MSVKTATSSLTATQRIINIIWYRTAVKIKQLFHGGTPEASTTPPSPITDKLPRDIVIEVILSYFIYDTPSLLACSMTCRSWYIAAVPYLHHSLTTDNGNWRPEKKYLWPEPLRQSYKLGLLPLVKRLRIRVNGYRYEFTPACLDRRTLCYFSALKNLQELGIDRLQVSAFMPTIRRCFGHFSPTLRFLALKEPNGSSRQILYFVGLFPNLQDLKLNYRFPKNEEESTADATLIPLSIPPLRGRLTLTCFTRTNLVEDIITLFGGLRFCYMDLFRVDCARLLLGACAETLEMLRLYPTDPYEDNPTLFQRFNLSKNKRLRTLEITTKSINAAGDVASDFLKTILSSVRSPEPLDIVVIFQDHDFTYVPPCVECRFEPDSPHSCSRETMVRVALRRQWQLRAFREMRSVRDFRLVLCADVSSTSVERVMEILEPISRAETVQVGSDHILYKPPIIFERRILRTRRADDDVGSSWEDNVNASAL